MAFSATDAALEGFRLVRAHPKAAGWWALACLVFNLVAVILMIVMAGPQLTDLVQSSGDPGADPQEVMSLMTPLLGVYGLLIPISLLFLGVLTAAIYRATLTETTDRLGFLRLGADEARLILVSLVVGVIGVVVILLMTILAGMAGGFLAVAMSGGGEPNIGATIVMMAIMYITMIFASIAFYVKFSFAGPMTFLDRKVRIFHSWGATRGYFWRLFGCYFLAAILGVLVALLGWFIGMAVMMALGGGMAQMMTPDMSSLAAYLTPGMIAYTVVSSAISALTYAIFLAPAMAAYRDIRGPSAPATAEVFA